MLFNAVSFLRENYSAIHYYLRALRIIRKICDIWRRFYRPLISVTKIGLHFEKARLSPTPFSIFFSKTRQFFFQ